LERVSTVRGSGWVEDQRAIFPNNFDFDVLTHPLPRTVLTRSNNDVRLLRQSHW